MKDKIKVTVKISEQKWFGNKEKIWKITRKYIDELSKNRNSRRRCGRQRDRLQKSHRKKGEIDGRIE